MSARRRLDAALRAYVEGRDRGWDLGRKLGPSTGPEPEIEFGSAPVPPRFGVGVPERLDFRRGPARWRAGNGAREESTDG